MIEAITFDLDGVYFPDGKARFIKSIEDRGVPKDEVKRVFLDSDEMNSRYKLGKMTDEQFWVWAINEWHLDAPPQEIIDVLVASYNVDQNVADIVLSVREQGYKTLICSNNFPARVNGLQEQFHFLDNFDVAVFSYEVSAAKPSEAIFSELIRRADLPAESIVFADDDAKKLSGAEALGIVTFVYDGFESFVNRFEALGVNRGNVKV